MRSLRHPAPSLAPSLALVCIASFACGDGGGTATSDPSTTGTESSSSSSSESSSSTAPPETTNPDPDDSSSSEPPPETTSESGSSESDPSGGAVCGNGVIEGSEDCDCGEFSCTPDSLDNKKCSDVDDPLVPGDLTGGILGCNPSSCRFDTSMCSWCGDEFIGEGEDCEPETPIDVACSDVGMGSAGIVTCGPACTYDVSACTSCGARFEFQADNCPHGFTVAKLDAAASGVSWQCGDPTNFAEGPGDEVTGTYSTNLAGNYNAHEISALISPDVDLSMCAAGELELELVHWFDFEAGDDNSDGGLVQISTDGTTWTTITPSSGVLYSPTAIDATYPPVQGASGFSGFSPDDEGEGPAWVSSVFDLSDYSGEDSVRVRMILGSDENVQRAGWYIDTLEVRGTAR